MCKVNGNTHIIEAMQHEIDAIDTLSALAYCRRIVLQRASTLLEPSEADQPVRDQAEALQSASALLMTSLEALKVAEEELREQRDRLANQQAVMDDAVHHYRQMFRHAPLPVILTDRYGTIHEANVLAAQLFRRDPDYLHRKPLAALVATPSHDQFRTQLAMMDEDRTREWRLELRRRGAGAVEVWATVGFVPGLGPNHSGLLCWMVHPRPVEDQ